MPFQNIGISWLHSSLLLDRRVFNGDCLNGDFLLVLGFAPLNSANFSRARVDVRYESHACSSVDGLEFCLMHCLHGLFGCASMPPRLGSECVMNV